MLTAITPIHFQSTKKQSEKQQLKAVAGAAVGTIVPMAILMRQKKISNPLKMTYGLQDMLILSATSIAGGVAGGMIGEKKSEQKKKLKEGVFQFLNASIPTWIIGGVLKLPEESHHFNNAPVKIFSVLGGLLVGMFGAAQISNLVFDPKDKEPDRKLQLKDCIANIDDVFGALVLAKFSFIEHLKLDKILPLIYAYCGVRAGNAK